VIALAMLAPAAVAQTPSPTPTLPPALTDYQDMMAEYEAAQAAARRPGDEALSCEAIRVELETAVNDPAMQAYVNSSAEQAQLEMAYAQAAMTGVPNASVPAVPAADLAAQQAARVEQLNAILPLLMRAQRLSELAALNACAWLSEGGYSLPTAEPMMPLQ
jgi:hypothetical protein